MTNGQQEFEKLATLTKEQLGQRANGIKTIRLAEFTQTNTRNRMAAALSSACDAGDRVRRNSSFPTFSPENPYSDYVALFELATGTLSKLYNLCVAFHDALTPEAAAALESKAAERVRLLAPVAVTRSQTPSEAPRSLARDLRDWAPECDPSGNYSEWVLNVERQGRALKHLGLLEQLGLGESVSAQYFALLSVFIEALTTSLLRFHAALLTNPRAALARVRLASSTSSEVMLTNFTKVQIDEARAQWGIAPRERSPTRSPARSSLSGASAARPPMLAPCGEVPLWSLRLVSRRALGAVRAISCMARTIFAAGDEGTIFAASIGSAGTNGDAWETARGTDDLSWQSFPGHLHPVLCFAEDMQTAGEGDSSPWQQLVSADASGLIQWWRLPVAKALDAVAETTTAALSIRFAATLTGHVGPVWSLAVHPHLRLLLSAGADGTARIWSAPPALASHADLQFAPPACVAVFDAETGQRRDPADWSRANEKDGLAAARWVGCSPRSFVAALRSGTIVLFDLERGAVARSPPISVRMALAGAPADEDACSVDRVTALECHHTLPLCISGHESGQVLLWDLREMSAPVRRLGGVGMAGCGAVVALALDTEGFFVAAATTDGRMHYLELHSGVRVQALQMVQRSRSEGLTALFHRAGMIFAGGVQGEICLLEGLHKPV